MTRFIALILALAGLFGGSARPQQASDDLLGVQARFLDAEETVSLSRFLSQHKTSLKNYTAVDAKNRYVVSQEALIELKANLANVLRLSPENVSDLKLIVLDERRSHSALNVDRFLIVSNRSSEQVYMVDIFTGLVLTIESKELSGFSVSALAFSGEPTKTFWFVRRGQIGRDDRGRAHFTPDPEASFVVLADEQGAAGNKVVFHRARQNRSGGAAIEGSTDYSSYVFRAQGSANASLGLRRVLQKWQGGEITLTPILGPNNFDAH